MREHHIAGHIAVRQADGMGIARRRGSERLEAERLEIARGADVPRIGNDEAAALVQAAKGLALVSGTHCDFPNLADRLNSAHLRAADIRPPKNRAENAPKLTSF